MAIAAGVNSFTTESEFNSYLSSRLGADSFLTASAAERNEKALILATQLIDQFDFIGKPTSITQPLQWPRNGAVGRNCEPVAVDAIPTGIKTATSELAYFLLKNDTTDPEQYLLNIQNFLPTATNVAKSVSSKRATKKLPDNVMDLLKPFLLEESAFSAKLNF